MESERADVLKVSGRTTGKKRMRRGKKGREVMTGYFSPFPLLTADVISHSPRTHSRSNLKLLWTALLMLHNQMKTFITCTVHRLHTYRHTESQTQKI